MVLTSFLKTNMLYCGDNLHQLSRYVPAEPVDLVYLDRPFFSNKNANYSIDKPNSHHTKELDEGLARCRCRHRRHRSKSTLGRRLRTGGRPRGRRRCQRRLEELCPVGVKCRLFHALGETTYGRLVGDLIVNGKNVVHVLVDEKLAKTGPVPLAP
jgi:endonuclease YncB( thermonuclease family)